jgi:thioredoxin reductase (NADPH)
MEEALFLTRFASEVHLIHRRDQFRASQIMVDRAKANKKIIFHLNAQITEILGESKVEGIKIINNATAISEELSCAAVFAALGHVPCNEVFKNAGIELDDHGFVITRDNTTKTNITGVFAAGDCADPRYRQAITAAGTGARAAIDAEKFLAEI